MAFKETDTVNRWLRKWSGWGVFFRVHVGRFWAGKVVPVHAGDTVTIKPGDVLLRGARSVTSGVTGQADWNGWHSMVIRPEHVGKRIAVYVAMEGKSADGVLSDEQEKHLQIVRNAGGLAFVVRSPDDQPPEF